MNMLKQLNAAIAYIESNLCAEFDLDVAAGIACVTADSFLRFFSYMTGMTPSVYRKSGGSLKVYPPARFHIIVKGAREMDFRIMELRDTVVYGVSKPYADQGYKNREELRNIMWANDCDNVPGQICEGQWNEPGSTSYDGVWQDGKYMIGREKADTKTEKLEICRIPAGTYAAFKTECGGFAWEEIPKLLEQIFDSWLPASEYRQKQDLVIEVLHLWTDRDMRQKNRYYEVWIPVELKD